VLARNAHDVYWLGRHLVRAEHTARMLDGLFHADLEGRSDDPFSVRLTWDSLLTIMGSRALAPVGSAGPARRDDVIASLTLDPDNPVSIRACVERAREGARTVRDTISAEMWESVNTFNLELESAEPTSGLQTGPYSIYAYVKERTALFWGLTSRTMQKDEARAFLVAGGRLEAADMVLRMLRVALPPLREAEEDEHREVPRRDGNALALLRAVGGFQAFMRSAAAPPNAGPVTRFLLFDRDFPDSVAASVESLHGALTRADVDPRLSPPVLRLARIAADLEFRSGAEASGEALAPAFREVQHELDAADNEIDARYFQGQGVTRQDGDG
jgi:uncharacterized alpha-E superfamily protein